MGSLTQMAADKGKKIEKIVNNARIQQIHYTKLKASDKNFYGLRGIEDLAAELEIAGRILNPLIVRKIDMGAYEILSGHRRRAAALCCIDKGMKQFEFLPCIEIRAEDAVAQVMDIDDEEAEDIYAEYVMMISNCSDRGELTDYENMMQAVGMKKILPKLKGNEELKGRALRQVIARTMNKADGTIGTYEAIYNKLCPEGMRRFERQEIGISVAYALTGLTAEDQRQLIARDNISLRDVEDLKNIRNRESVRAFDQEKRKAVSDSDTRNVLETAETLGMKTDRTDICEKVEKTVSDSDTDLVNTGTEEYEPVEGQMDVYELGYMDKPEEEKTEYVTVYDVRTFKGSHTGGRKFARGNESEMLLFITEQICKEGMSDVVTIFKKLERK